MARFLIVEARFYDHLNDMLVAGSRAAREAAGHDVDVLTVPGDYPTINAAISAAVSGDRIEVSAGTYPELVLIDGVRLEVVAVDGPGSTEIVAPSAFARCVLVSGVGSSDCVQEVGIARAGV